MLFVIFSSLFVVVASGKTDSLSTLRNAACSKNFSVSCLKLDLIGLLERSGGGDSYEVLPGFVLRHNLTVADVPQELLEDVLRGNHTSRDLDGYVSSVVHKYLSSVTLTVNVLDKPAISRARSWSDHILTSLLPSESGRGKKGKGGGYLSGAMWAGGMAATVAMAGLAMITGKAMITSMLALALAGVTTLKRGHNNGNGCAPAHFIQADSRAIEPIILEEHVKPYEIISSHLKNTR